MTLHLGDPLRRSINTTVISAEVYQPPPPEPGKRGKKAVVAPTLPSDPIVLVILHDTVIFPEGGGQPTDTGIITTTADGKQWEVVQCKRHGGHAVHYVRVKDSNVDAALAALTPGSAVISELGAQDFERRYDHVRAQSYLHMDVLPTDSGIDVDAHFPASSFRPPRDPPQSPDPLLVSHVLSTAMLR